MRAHFLNGQASAAEKSKTRKHSTAEKILTKDKVHRLLTKNKANLLMLITETSFSSQVNSL